MVSHNKLLPMTGDIIRAWLPWVLIAAAIIILIVVLCIVFSGKKAKKADSAPRPAHSAAEKDSGASAGTAANTAESGARKISKK